MGNKVFSYLKRPIQNYNVEGRAHKLISKEKPVPAPRHEKDEIMYQQMMREHPEAYTARQIKHADLDNYLKNVYVKSYDPIIEQNSKTSQTRLLPMDRSEPPDFEYGIKEPARVREGRLTLKNALKLISDHQHDPKLHKPEKLATDYSIPIDTIKSVLKYYRVLEVYIPQERKSKAQFAGPSIPRKRLGTKIIKELPAPPQKTETT